MKRNYLLVAFLASTLILTSCNIINRQRDTPIPEQPVSEMSAQPVKGVAGGDSIADPYFPELGNTGYDVQQYKLAMEFSSQLDVITATVTISSVITLNDLGRISLDFHGFQVDSVRVGKNYVPSYRSPEKLYVDLPKTYAVGKALVVQVSYHGRLAPNYSPNSPAYQVGLVKPAAHENYVFALIEPDGAHFWYPCNDHPLDKATYHFELTVPKGSTAIANGSLLRIFQADKHDTYVWEESAPMASYLSMLAVGEYQHIAAQSVGDVQINYYVTPDESNITSQLADFQSILRFYSDLIAPYPFNQLGMTVVDLHTDATFAMESQTMMIFDRKMVDTPNIDYVLAHEIVHHWFGDHVSLASWGEVWLKEGLATYLSLLWLDHQGRTNSTTLLTGMERDVLTYGKIQALNQPRLDDMYGSNTYGKGAWVFYMLRNEIGDEAFFKFLRQYYLQFAGSNASTSDLQQVAEQVSGKDLDAFFQQWVYTAGNPYMHLTWAVQPTGVSLQVCQVGGIFNLPLEVQLEASDGGSLTQVLQIDEKQEQADINLPFSVKRLVADPDQKVLATVIVSKGDAFVACGP